MSRILVTGGAGAIGSNLVARLIDENHEVIVLDDFSSGQEDNLKPSSMIKIVKGDVRNFKDVASVFRDFEPKYVVHMAALFANQNSIEHPVDDLMTNGIGILNVLECSHKYNVKRFVFTSSSCVYGAKFGLTTEYADIDPETPYAFTKWLGEKYCQLWQSKYDLNIVVLRLFNSYGPNEYPGKYRNVIPNFFGLAINKKPLPITGDGSETRDFTYVSDTVSGILNALFTPNPSYRIFNISSGRSTKIIDLAKCINKIAGNDKIEFIPKRKWDSISHRAGSNDLACKYLGYRPIVGLEEGLQHTYDWIKNKI